MGHDLIVIGAAFLLAGLLARAGRSVGLPTIPLFMAAGVLVGPNTPGPVLFEHPDQLELLSAFGLIFLLFSLGLETSMSELTDGGGRLLASAGIYLALNIGAGLALGFAIGWGTREAFIVAGVTGISSSAIVSKVLTELRRMANPETRMILGIIVLEDLFLALYLAALAPVLGEADGFAEALVLFGRALGFLMVLALAARHGTRIVGRLIYSDDDELLVVLFVGFALLVAGASAELGVSDAIGAFMAGLVLSATVAAGRIRTLVLPLRDAFAAVFFFSFGLAIDPDALGPVVVAATVAIVASLVLSLVAAITAARLNGFDSLGAVNLAFTIVARGEFALILAALATGAGLDERLTPFVGLYVAVLAVLGPVLASRSVHLRWLVPRRLLDERARAGAPR